MFGLPRTATTHTGLISGPASVARGASMPPAGPPLGEKNAIYAGKRAQKLRNKVRLNASRVSKRRVSGCLGMSWRRNVLF